MAIIDTPRTTGRTERRAAPRSPVLHFLGAAGTVTGSRYLVDSGRARVLVEAGLFQGLRELRDRNWAPFPVDPRSIDAVVLSHAHLDHIGYLPVLIRHGFHGPVYATHHTAELAEIVLADAGRLQEEEAGYANRKGYSKHHPAEPLFTEEDASHAARSIVPVRFGEDVEVADHATVRFRRAGHILGSASLTLTLGTPPRTLLVSGDLGRPGHPLLRPPEDPAEADLMLIESTYGDRRHAHEDAALDTLAGVITRTLERGGVVVIPAFAVDRTEVMLMHLGELMVAQRIPRVPIFCDSPMALSVLDVYRRALARADTEVHSPSSRRDPFDPVGVLREARTPDESRALNAEKSAIIISSSGMATGGRVLHHLANRLPDHRNSVILVGYQAAGTRGRSLADGASTVKMLGRHVPVEAEISEIEAFSVHADSDELITWARHAPRAPELTYVVHGEPQASQALETRIVRELGRHAAVPALGENIRLD